MNQVSTGTTVLSVRRIKEYSFYIDEGLYIPGKPELKVELSLQISFSLEMNLVFIMLRAYYRYPDAPPNEIITDIQVQNVFEIEDLKRFQVSETEIKLPKDVITSLVDLSITHTRALLAKNTLGTVLQENVMAI